MTFVYPPFRQVFHCLARRATQVSGVRVIRAPVTTRMPSPALPGLDRQVAARRVTASRSSHCSRTSMPRSICLMRMTVLPLRPCQQRVSPFRPPPAGHPVCPGPPASLGSPCRHLRVCATLSMNNTPLTGLQWTPTTVNHHDTRAIRRTPRVSLTPPTVTFTDDLVSPPHTTAILLGRKMQPHFTRGDDPM